MAAPMAGDVAGEVEVVREEEWAGIGEKKKGRRMWLLSVNLAALVFWARVDMLVDGVDTAGEEVDQDVVVAVVVVVVVEGVALVHQLP